MTEEEELLKFGTAMYRMREDGTREHIPREQWCLYYRYRDVTKEELENEYPKE